MVPMNKTLNELLAEGQLEEAKRVIAERLRADPTSVESARIEALAAKAKLLLSDLELDEAEGVLELVPPDAQNHIDVIQVKAMLHGLRGEDEAALGLFDEVNRREPGRAEAHFGAGISLARLDDLPSARVRLEDAIRLSPATGIYHYHLARCLIELEEIDSALAELGQAIELDPLQPDAYVSLARISTIVQRPEEARKILEKGLELMPGQAQLLAELTNVSVVSGDIGAGLEAASELAETSPDDPVAQNNYALHLLAHNKIDEVVELCTTLHDRGVRSAQLSCTLANAYDAQGDVESAMVVYSEAVKQDLSDWRAPNNLALLLLQTGDDQVVPDAILLLEEANRRQPEQLEPLLNLAIAYARGHQNDKATDLARYVASYDLQPDHPIKDQAERLVKALTSMAPA